MNNDEEVDDNHMYMPTLRPKKKMALPRAAEARSASTTSMMSFLLL